MTAKLQKKLICLFLFFTMLVFTLLFLFLAGSSVKKVREAEVSYIDRLADGIVDELLQGRILSTQDLLDYAEHSHVWVRVSDGRKEQAGPDCFQTPVSDLMAQILSKTSTIGSEEVVSNRQAKSVSSRTIHYLTGPRSETYYGIQVHLYGAASGDYDLFLIYPATALWDILKTDCGYYPLLWLFALAVMYGMSRFLIRRALLPVTASLKSQKEFIAAASHELKTPLAVIQANAEALEPAKGTSGPRELAVILEECGRMTELLTSLLTLAATDAGSFRIEEKETDMDTLLIETWEAFLPACRKKGIVLELDMGEACCPKIRCDRERIGQVVRILLDNALDHSPAGASILLKSSVETSRSGNFFLCSVIDHGPGIPDEEKRRVFDRFFCGDASRTDKNHFGLGLCIAKEIMEKHRGRLLLFDTPKGGCTFQIHLPLFRPIE